MSDKQGVRESRRAFIKKMAIAGGTTAAATLVGGQVAAAEETEEAPASKGYRETAHVRAYYRTARN